MHCCWIRLYYTHMHLSLECSQNFSLAGAQCCAPWTPAGGCRRLWWQCLVLTEFFNSWTGNWSNLQYHLVWRSQDMQGLAFDLFQHFSSSSRAAEFFIGKSWTGKTVSRRQAHVSWEWMLRIQCVYIYIHVSFVFFCSSLWSVFVAWKPYAVRFASVMCGALIRSIFVGPRSLDLGTAFAFSAFAFSAFAFSASLAPFNKI